MFTIATAAVIITMIIVNYKSSRLEQTSETKTIDISVLVVAFLGDLIMAAMIF